MAWNLQTPLTTDERKQLKALVHLGSRCTPHELAEVVKFRARDLYQTGATQMAEHLYRRGIRMMVRADGELAEMEVE